MQYSGAGGKLIHQKNQKQKISWHCPFNTSGRKEEENNNNNNMQKVDKKNMWEEEDNMSKYTSNKDTSYQDMPYQDTSYQDMPYTTWKIRDTGEQKQVKRK